MTNAEKHVAALVAAFGAPPFALVAFDCLVHELEAVGNTVRARVEWAPGRVDEWKVPDPEILIPDPAGPVERVVGDMDDDGNPASRTVTLREDPIAVATAELSSFLRAVRS